jgi:hypothetical protein
MECHGLGCPGLPGGASRFPLHTRAAALPFKFGWPGRPRHGAEFFSLVDLVPDRAVLGDDLLVVMPDFGGAWDKRYGAGWSNRVWPAVSPCPRRTSPSGATVFGLVIWRQDAESSRVQALPRRVEPSGSSRYSLTFEQSYG